MFNLETKRAAIFGMDARIAIIVFSILGVVGAYYAEDVISKAQEDSVVEQVITLRQAVQQNLADNDYDYTIDDTNLNTNPFGIKSVTTNLGRGRNNHSYISASNIGNSSSEIVINTPARVIRVTTDNLYASVAETGATAGTVDCVNTSATCYYWFRLLDVDEKSFKLLDKYYDATTGGFADAASTNAGIIVAPTIDTGNDTATVLVKIGER